jgi:hypothetical protein
LGAEGYALNSLEFQHGGGAVLSSASPWASSKPEDCLGYYDPPDIPSGFTKQDFCTVNKEVQRWDWKADTLSTLKAFPFVSSSAPRPEDPELFEFTGGAKYSPDGSYIALVKKEVRKSEVVKNLKRVDKIQDSVVEIRHPHTFELLAQYRSHEFRGGLVVSADGRFIAFYSKRNLVKIIEVIHK